MELDKAEDHRRNTGYVSVLRICISGIKIGEAFVYNKNIR